MERSKNSDFLTFTKDIFAINHFYIFGQRSNMSESFKAFIVRKYKHAVGHVLYRFFPHFTFVSISINLTLNASERFTDNESHNRNKKRLLENSLQHFQIVLFYVDHELRINPLMSLSLPCTFGCSMIFEGKTPLNYPLRRLVSHTSLFNKLKYQTQHLETKDSELLTTLNAQIFSFQSKRN